MAEAALRTDNERLTAEVEALTARLAETQQQPPQPNGEAALSSATMQLSLVAANAAMLGQKPKLPEYSGDIKGGLPWSQFLNEFEIHVKLYGLDDKAAAQLLPRCLKGHALQYYMDTAGGPPPLVDDEGEEEEEGDIMSSFAKIKTVLTEHFNALEGGSRYGSSAFYLRKQANSESVIAFYTDLMKLAKRAYPDPAQPMPDTQILERFVRGLVLPIRRAVIAREPADLEAALRLACKVQAQREMLLEDEPVAVSSVQPDNLSHQIAQLTSQVGQLLTENSAGQRSWADPAHHFPSGYRGRSQERPPPPQRRNMQYGGYQQRQGPNNYPRSGRRPPPQRQVNMTGDIRCWNCQQWGHYRASCRLPPKVEQPARNNRVQAPRAGGQTPQINAVEAAKESPSGRTTTRTGGASIAQPQFYLALVCCLMCVYPVSTQRPMVCQTTIKGQLFAVPKPLECHFGSLNQSGTSSPETYQIFKRNLLKYASSGFLCKAVYSEARLFTYLFGIEHLKEFKTEAVAVEPKLCASLVRDKNSPTGPLRSTHEGVWQTQNSLDWRTPSWTADECCRWWQWDVVNYYIIPVTVYSRHGRTEFESTGADMSRCPSYRAGFCQVGKQSLVWSVNQQWSCQYLPSLTLQGRKLGATWLSDDGMLALTQTQNTTVTDCGVQLQISDQGLAYQTLETNSTRSKRDIESSVGIVLSDQQASQLQALYTQLREESHFLYKHSLHLTCNSLRSIDALLHATVISHPTLTMRLLLNDTYLIATACNKAIEVWPCSPLKKVEFKFKSQRNKCTKEIPVSFSFRNQTHDGYLHPATLIVSHHGTPDDCERIGSIPIALYKKTFLYSRKTGDLSPVRQVTPLTLIKYQTSDDFDSLMPVEIFKPVVLYNWPELVPNSSLNALWHTTRAKTEIFETLSSYFNQDESSLGEGGSASPGLALSSLFLLSDPFHLWLSISCALLNAYLFMVAVARCKQHGIPRQVYHKWRPLLRFRRRRAPSNNIAGEPSPEQEAVELMPLSTNAQNLVDTNTVEPLEDVVRRYAAEVNEVAGFSKPLTIQVSVEGQTCTMLVDSGSSISLVSSPFARLLKLPTLPVAMGPAVSVSGEPLYFNGMIKARISVGGKVAVHNFMIYDHCRYDGIIGLDILAKAGPMKLDLQAQMLCLGGVRYPLAEHDILKAKVAVSATTVVAPRTMAIVYCTLPSSITPGTTLLFEQDADKSESVVCPRTLIKSAEAVPIRVINHNLSPVTLYAHSTLGYAEAIASVVDSVSPAVTPELLDNSTTLPGLDLSNATLSDVERIQLTELLVKYRHLFAASDTDLPGTQVCEHKIVVNNETPLKQKAYRVPQSKRAELDDKIDSMLEAGIISPSCSPWASPVVLVTKPDNSLRVCIDYRRLNAVTVPDAHPLPHIDEAMQFLSGAKYLTTLDLYAGYHQVSVAPESRKYTAFISEKGLFEFNRLSFGLRNAPSTFARLMNFVLTGLLFSSAIVYLDDVLVASKTFTEHLTHLEQVFQRLAYYNLRLKLKKCSFVLRALPFLGFKISPQGILPDPANVCKLREMPRPTTVTQVRSFLGLSNYYRKFVEGYAELAKPLTKLTQKATRFRWDDACQSAFESLILRLTNAPLLRYPRFDQEFVVAVDASQYACGAVLSQISDGKDQPIAYFSHTFQPTETRYSTVERELYAIVLAMKHWKHYLYGYRVIVYSDQQSISWGLKPGDSPRLARWTTQLSEFDIELRYRPGPKNKPADFLSRIPGSAPEVVSTVSADAWASFALGYGGFDLRAEQKKDRVCYNALRILEEEQTFDKVPLGLKPLVKTMMREAEVDPQSGCLIQRSESANGALRFMVPCHLQAKIIKECHDSVTGGHLSFEKTVGKVLQRFYWHGLRTEVRNWVTSCEVCLTRRAQTQPIREPLQPIGPVAPGHSYVIDILGPLSVSNKGNKYILVMMDRFTKWPECAALKNQNAATVAKAFVSLVVARHGVPKHIQSDRGTQFTSTLMREVSVLLGINHQVSTAYHPQSQGLVERFNKTLCHLLRSYVDSGHKDWCSYLDLVLFAYRTSPHSSTGATPFELEHGRQARLPIQLLCPEEEIPQTAEDYAESLKGRLAEAFELARSNMQTAAELQKQAYDRRVKLSNIAAGDKVYVKRPHPAAGLSPKLQPTFKGPYVVIRREGTSLVVKPEHGLGRPDTIHVNDCKLVVDRLPHLLWPEEHAAPETEARGATARSSMPSETLVTPENSPEASREITEPPRVEPSGIEVSKREPASNSEPEPVGDLELSAWDDERRDYNLRPRVPQYYGY